MASAAYFLPLRALGAEERQKHNHKMSLIKCKRCIGTRRSLRSRSRRADEQAVLFLLGRTETGQHHDGKEKTRRDEGGRETDLNHGSGPLINE